jgi:hypothetical protein
MNNYRLATPFFFAIFADLSVSSLSNANAIFRITLNTSGPCFLGVLDSSSLKVITSTQWLRTTLCACYAFIPNELI